MYKSRKYSPAVYIIIRAISFIVLFVIVWEVYLLIFPHARVTFKTYKPNGYAIHGAEEILYAPDVVVRGLHNIFKPEVMIFFKIRQPNLSILERKVAYTKSSCENIAANQTCAFEKTGRGQTYSLTTTTDAYLKDNRAEPSTSQEAEVVMGSVGINITCDNSVHWNKAQWDTFIDSFKQSRFPGLKSVWSEPGP